MCAQFHITSSPKNILKVILANIFYLWKYAYLNEGDSNKNMHNLKLQSCVLLLTQQAPHTCGRSGQPMMPKHRFK